jgi:hypothetical protein
LLGQEKPTLCLAHPDYHHKHHKNALLSQAANILDDVLWFFDWTVSRAEDVNEQELDQEAPTMRIVQESAEWRGECYAVQLGLKSIAAVGLGSNQQLRTRTSRLALALALICETIDILKSVCVVYPGLEPLVTRCLEIKKDEALSIIPGLEHVPPPPSQLELCRFAMQFHRKLGLRGNRMISVDV